jgi:predicted dehydrogenase
MHLDSSVLPGQTSRREFLQSTGALTAASALATLPVPRVHAVGSDVLQVALIGCGGRGTGAAANALATQVGRLKLVAMADIFPERLNRSYETLRNASSPREQGTADAWISRLEPAQVEVPPDRRFLGFDAYRKAMECLRPGDIVILTTPVAFRWPHFAYAIARGLNVFMEKPITVDGPTTRKMIALAEEASRKNLKVGVGLMCRHCEARKELLARLQGGEIGELTTLRTYRQVSPAGFVGPRPSSQSELLYQIQHYLGFFWASGGVFHDYVAHNVDECCWMKGAWPVRAQGQGARLYRGAAVDQNFDNYSIEYTFADGTKLILYSRYMPGCHEEFASYALGTKGSAVISTFVHTPAKCRIFKGYHPTRANLVWAAAQPEPNPYQLEWDHLVEAILKNQAYNEVKRGAEASLVVAMGRKAVHTGQVVEYEAMLADDEEFAPSVDKLTMESPAPLQAEASGAYPGPQPGIKKSREC